MKTIINNIFTEEEFVPTDLQIGTLYKLSEKTNKTKYWLIIELDNLSNIKLQNKWFTLCTEANKDKQLPKNISLLILHRISESVDLLKLKKDVLNIEEDPYLFKKYVLYYRDTEMSNFNKQAGTKTPNEFLKTTLVNEECFSEYKRNSTKYIWQSLVYRLANKIPFVKIQINESEGLESLFESNNRAIEKNHLEEFDENVFKVIDKKSIQDLKEMKELDLLELLNPKKEENGDKN